MILHFPDGKQIRGDLIKSITLRSDLSPIPVTLEAEIRAGEEDMDKRLAEGRLLIVGGGGDALRIIKSVRVSSRVVQGGREMVFYRITALLDACQGVAHVRGRAIIKENASLAAIYRAAGAVIKGVEADFPVPRFCCPVGDTPTLHIARVLQEEGGVVRWKHGKLQFVRLGDLFKQPSALTLPNYTTEDVESGFMERHAVPWFFSLDPSGAVIYGNRDKPRSVRFSPFKNAQRLLNMTRCLVLRKISRVTLSEKLTAGDLIDYAGGAKLAVITAAHVVESGAGEGEKQNAYTRIWAGSLKE